MISYINGAQEFYEVVNAFPVLRNVLERFHIGFNTIKEGETVDDFLEKNCMSKDEAYIILNRLNREIKVFLEHSTKTLSLSDFETPCIEAEEEEE